MYLERAEMAVALHTATRLARAGGSFCFTHFVEPQGEPKGSIVQPISRTALHRLATAAGMVDVRLHPMRHQGDRYAMTARAPELRRRYNDSTRDWRGDISRSAG